VRWCRFKFGVVVATSYVLPRSGKFNTVIAQVDTLEMMMMMMMMMMSTAF
jgi:hypothetical protein